MLKVHIIQSLLSENTGIELEIKKESMYQKGMYQKGKYSVSTIPWHKKKKKSLVEFTSGRRRSWIEIRHI